ncbi:MAG: alpha/beta fold hydrolase [Planctomycetota bacterium]|nr:alpha/beta fold hydrolase [Planctomycetota bacterium]
MSYAPTPAPASPSPWFLRPQLAPDAAFRLFCFPFAGGGASTFAGWQRKLAAPVDVWPVQLPGRENRRNEPAHDELDALVAAIADALAPHLHDRPFALFGHSMGATVAFSLARRLRRAGLPQPVALLVSGDLPPHRPDPRPPLRDLPDDEFWTELRARYGSPQGMEAAPPELVELMIPTLRADVAVCESHRHHDEPPLPFPIFAMAGSEDPSVGPEDVAAWSRHTSARFTQRIVPGDHFYISPLQPQAQAELGMELRRLAAAMRQERPT